MVEFGHVSWCPAFRGADLAKEDEDLGFDVRYFGDNTCVAPDPFAELRAAAEATTRIKLATGCTNTVTKHPSAVATAMASVQLASAGRAICGVGKGDSSMAVIGQRPQRHAEFLERTAALRTYLRGETIHLDGWESRLEWLDGFPEFEPVPLEIMCSGPRTIAAAATMADRITLSVGGAPERIRWAMDVIDEALERGSRNRRDVRVGALLPLVIDDDWGAAAERLRPRVPGSAHMSSLPGNDLTDQPARLRKVTTELRQKYDYRHHNVEPGNPLSELIDADFARWFGVGGPLEYVAERLAGLAELGVDYFVLGSVPLEERELMAAELFPLVRAATGKRQ